MAYWARLYVKLQTDAGAFERIGPAVEYTDAAAASVEVQSDALVYPDPRVVEFRLYVSGTSADADAGNFKLHSTWTAKPSAVNNISYAIQESALDLTIDLSGNDDMPDPDTLNSDIDRDPNRILISDVAQPHSYQAQRVGRAGDGPGDGVVAFGANTRPVSEGQFGTYPIFALCEESVSAGSLGQGGVAIASWNVIGQKGCIGRHAVANVDNQVFFASTDGVHVLEERLGGEPVSRPVHNASTVKDFYDCLGRDTALGWYNDEVRGRRELWVSAGNLTFILAYDYGRWSILDRARVGYGRLGGRLYGASKEGSADAPTESTIGAVMDERGSQKAVSVYLKTAPLDLEAQGYYKRLYALWIRQPTPAYSLGWRIVEMDLENGPVEIASGTIQRGDLDVAHLPSGLVREPSLELSAFLQPGQSVNRFGIEYEARFTHRRPALSMPEGADASTFQDVLAEALVWGCEEGFDDVAFVNSPPVWLDQIAGCYLYGFTFNDPEWVPVEECYNYIPS